MTGSLNGRLILAAALGLLVFAVSGVLVLDGEGASAHTWQCREYNTDYSERCMERSQSQCGRYCFYAVCIKCSDGSHSHTACDEDGCWTYSHWNGESPCLEWLWYLWDEPLEASRFFDMMTANLQQAFMFGAVHPHEAQCWEDEALTDILELNTFGPIRQRENGHFTNRIDDSVGHEAAGHLADTLKFPGEQVRAGAAIPQLVDALLVDVRTYELVLNVVAPGRVQYRVWPYSGFVPDDFGDPYKDLPSSMTVVVEKEGLHSFQVRTVIGSGDDLEVLGTSNVVHKVVGMTSPDGGVGLDDGLNTPQPVATPWALPSPTSGLPRPEPPEIESVVEDVEILGLMHVKMKTPFAGVLEYRYWVHSGFPFYNIDGGWAVAPALDDEDVFLVGMPRRSMYMGADDPLLQGGFEKPSYWNFEHPAFYNFQTRVVTVEPSEPSNIVVAFVWKPPPQIVPR